MKKNGRLVTAASVLILLSAPVFAVPKLAIDITSTSLEELMNIKISSLSKKQEPISRAPAAVYVLTRDEIRRTGVQHVAEALRYVPGVEVARIDAGRWAISVRGFNGRTANKLLVMIDGRSIYSSFFSGVLWEEKQLGLVDVERIEVIRGPGGSVWGSNAVNGVINIVTKHAEGTVGTLVDASVGNEQAHTLYARQGWQYGEDAWARVYVKSQEHQDSEGDFSGDDDNRQLQAGFRIDQRTSRKSTVRLSGDVYAGEVGQVHTSPSDGQSHRGHNLTFQWAYNPNSSTEHQLLSYYDFTDLETQSIDDKRRTWDMEYRYHKKRERHDSVWGVGYRRIQDTVETTPAGLISPLHETDTVLNAFFQEDFGFLDNRAHLVLGAKYERNDYSDAGWFPSIRASFSPRGVNGMVWAAWSEAQRIPTRLETDITLPGLNGDNFDAEKVAMSEIGWRQQWTKVSFDVTAFYGEYDDLLSLESDGIRNNIYGDSQGIEISANIQLTKQWLMRSNYSYLSLSLDTNAVGADTALPQITEGSSPTNTFQWASFLDVNSSWRINTFIRYVAALDSINVGSYTVADLVVAWDMSRGTTLRFIGRHIGDGRHREWGQGAPIENAYSLSLTWGM